MLIRSNGNVFLCVASPFVAKNSIGNIYQSTLSSMWNSPNRQKIINKLTHDMKVKVCKLGVCRGLRYNCLIQQKLNNSKTLAKDDFIKEPTLI